MIVYPDLMTREETNCRVQLLPVQVQVVLANDLRLLVIPIHTEADHLKEVIIIATTPHDLIQRNQFTLTNDQAAVSKIPSSLVIVQFQLIHHHLCNSSSNLEYNSNPIHNIHRLRYSIAKHFHFPTIYQLTVLKLCDAAAKTGRTVGTSNGHNC